MTTKKEVLIKSNRKEIVYNIINSLLAGAISFFSALLATGKITWEGIVISLATASLVALLKFKNYWDGEQKEYSTNLFKFL